MERTEETMQTPSDWNLPVAFTVYFKSRELDHVNCDGHERRYGTSHALIHNCRVTLTHWMPGVGCHGLCTPPPK